MDKKNFVELFETLKNYVKFQKTLNHYGYGVEEDNVGNKLALACIELIKSMLPKSTEVRELIEEFCWASEFATLYYPTFYFNETQHMVYSIEELYEVLMEYQDWYCNM